MDKEELLRYAGHRNGYVCVDIVFDPETKVIRATQIHYFKGSWSISLNYLPYGRLDYLREVENPNLDGADRLALIRGKYEDLDEITNVLEEFLNRPMSAWQNYSRLGYHILLTEQELATYQSIDWNNWIPAKITVPKGATFEIIKPVSWINKVDLQSNPN